MLGVSVYFKNYDIEYLKEVASLGIQYIFTSLQLPEDDSTRVKENLLTTQKDCKELGLKLIVDISPKTKEIFEINEYKELLQFGVEVVRLDYGIDINEMIELTNHFQVVMNASTLTIDILEEIKQYKIDTGSITAMHNFYPQMNTGLESTSFIEKNKIIKHYGLRVMAFVIGDATYRYPIYEGLPTLEQHRGVNPYVAMLYLKEKCYVDDILVGDSRVKIETLQMMAKLCQDVLTLPTFIEKSYHHLFNDYFNIREDSGDLVIRFSTKRNPLVEPFHCLNRVRGSIVLLNKNYQRYSGEIQIIKQSLPFDYRCNLIGYIHPEYIGLLDYINSKYKVQILDICFF